jgi:hypothetical protein
MVDSAAFFETEFAVHRDGARATHAVLTNTFGPICTDPAGIIRRLDRVS